MQLQRSMEALVARCRAENHGVKTSQRICAQAPLAADGRDLVDVTSSTELLWDLCPTCRPKGVKIMNRMGQYEYCDVVAVFDAAPRGESDYKSLSSMREIQAVQNSVRLQAVMPVAFSRMCAL